jgi:hypothetical protein
MCRTRPDRLASIASSAPPETGAACPRAYACADETCSAAKEENCTVCCAQKISRRRLRLRVMYMCRGDCGKLYSNSLVQVWFSIVSGCAGSPAPGQIYRYVLLSLPPIYYECVRSPQNKKYNGTWIPLANVAAFLHLAACGARDSTLKLSRSVNVLLTCRRGELTLNTGKMR